MNHADFHALHDLLVTYTAAENDLAAITVRLNAKAADTGRQLGPEILRLEGQRDLAAERAREILNRHPEWFQDTKTLKLPCGSVKSTTTTRIEPVLSEADALERLKLSDHPALCAAVRTIESLDLEVLGAFDDATLTSHGLRRVKTESITITAAKAHLGDIRKAAKAAAVATPVA